MSRLRSVLLLGARQCCGNNKEGPPHRKQRRPALRLPTMIGLVLVLLLSSCRGSSKQTVSPSQPCQLPAGPYQCQPVNNDAALQRIIDGLTADPATLASVKRARLGEELCAVSLVLTGVDLSPVDSPLIQRIRRLESLGTLGGEGAVMDPTIVPCPVTVRGAPDVLPNRAIIGCVFLNGSQCQPVNNGAALQRITDRLNSGPTANTKAAILIEESCAIDRVASGVLNPGFDTPLVQRWNDLAKTYRVIKNEDLATAQEAKCPALHYQTGGI